MAVWAQETRSVIFGRVTDPRDAAVAGAAVVITNVGTNLLAGNYRVTAELAGFKKSVRNGIVLPVSTRSEVSIKLVLGEVAESVPVTAEAPLLDTSSISSGRVMENRSVNDLP
ncbi:MAG: carboxypeptidase regulatory-like domain-containing protein, partial [Acidobacteria bacterium]|nr:carboxypeptidase regulatory-like domain-containing protein [Acidobacteriota bacterium]